jgi:hypothetical protein
VWCEDVAKSTSFQGLYPRERRSNLFAAAELAFAHASFNAGYINTSLDGFGHISLGWFIWNYKT